jgi:hypothetical protein
MNIVPLHIYLFIYYLFAGTQFHFVYMSSFLRDVDEFCLFRFELVTVMDA